ncbi:preprotein translocase subunit SecY, partial [Candidatus Bathyarchaeota archaeon]|nr:preprotein translocase subunit SecY [Candidatus Bathyarchaeota archaeon]
AQGIMWSSFSPLGPLDDGKQQGAFIALGQTILNGENIANAFFRIDPSSGGLTSYPSMLGFLTTVIVFVIVIYMEGIRIELPIAHANYRGFRGKYPIKLLYVSNLPVIFASALFANIQVLGMLIYGHFGSGNILVNILGTFDGQTPTGGLAYYVTAPRSLEQVAIDPVRALIFVGIMVTFAIIFSITWLEVGGLGPSTVAQQLVDSGMQIPGFRRSGKSIEIILKRYIPVVTILGGAIIGLVASVSEFFGVFGSGMGVLLAVGILYQYYQLLAQEQVAEMYPAFGRILG